MLDSFKNYYTILNVPETASHDEIKTAFRRMARLYSPDVNPDPSVVRHFEDVLEAWGVLSDPMARKAYDQGRGVWSPEDAGNVFATVTERKAEPVHSTPETPPPPPPDHVETFARRPQKQVSRGRDRERERDADFQEYFERGTVPFWVLGSLFLLGFTGWLRLESLTDGRGALKAFLQGAVWGAFFWLSFWGIRFYVSTLRSRRGGLPFLYGCLLGVPYAFFARWFLADVRSMALTFGVDWGLWYLSFVGIFVLCADSLERSGIFLPRIFRSTEESDQR